MITARPFYGGPLFAGHTSVYKMNQAFEVNIPPF